MNCSRTTHVLALGLMTWGVVAGFADAADWPMLGRDGTRNGVSVEVGAPTQWSVEER